MKATVLALMLCSLFISGCGFLFVARSRPATPAYCYDCHHRPGWHRVYTRCGYYEIVVIHDGYKYRPRKHGKHQEYKFAKYDRSRDQERREREGKKPRESGEKDTRSRN